MFSGLLPALLFLQPTQAGLEPELSAELRRHPASTARDLYKFIHQAEFGPGHMVPDAAMAKAYLERELRELGPAPADEPLTEELGNGLVRVNLRPYLAAGASMAALLEAFVATANAWRGSAGRMDARLAAAVRGLRGAGRNALADALDALAAAQAAKGHPALHHSEAYSRAYRPAYRVLRPGPWLAPRR